MTQTITRRAQIIGALYALVASRPGFEPGNYSTWASYRSEVREATQARRDAERLLREIELREQSFPLALLEQSLDRGGRLELVDRPKGVAINYCAGQYYCVEFRPAVVRWAAGLLWADKCDATPPGEGKADAIRAHFARQFGRRIANRYFS